MPKTADELKFWKECYCAALASGKSNRHAAAAAGQSLTDLRDAVEAMGVNVQAAA